MGLDLYAKIEEMFLDKEAASLLWGKFIEILKDLELKEVLDIGCGSGDFCLLAKKEGFFVEGVDLSAGQVKKAREKGCGCEVKDICEMSKKYESAVAVFDVVNYIAPEELKKFFECVEKRVEKYFIFDINTVFAMEDLAVGTLKAEDKNRFSVLQSDFEDGKLITEITFFYEENGCYKKRQNRIVQYFHPLSFIKESTKMKLKEVYPISLYGSNEPEKLILVMQIS